MTIPVVFEDHAFLCINKPPGIVVNRAQSVAEPTVQDWMMSTYPALFESYPVSAAVDKDQEVEGERHYDPVQEFVSRSGIVHRIDKETSGLLFIAKTPEVFAAFKEQFMNRTIKKTYLAIVHGVMPSREGEIDAPVGRLPWNRERFGVVPDGKSAITRYTVVSTHDRKSKHIREKIQLIECFPETGRTHQIRVHLKYTNRPIVGDYLYAGRKTARDDREWVPRVMLHAYKAAFTHPTSGHKEQLEAPMPQDMKECLESLVRIS